MSRFLDAPSHPFKRLRGRRLLSLSIDVAIVVVVIGVVLSFSSVRDALFGGGGSSNSSAVKLSPVASAGPLDIGRRVSLGAARDAAAFSVLVPMRKGYEKPDAVYFREKPSGGSVSLLYGSEDHIRLLVTEFAGSKAFEGTERLAPAKAEFHYTQVGRGLGAWLLGERGRFSYRDNDEIWQVDRFRLAGNVLLFERPPLVVTIEGKLPFAEATAIASSMRTPA